MCVLRVKGTLLFKRKLENENKDFLTFDCILDITGWRDKSSLKGDSKISVTWNLGNWIHTKIKSRSFIRTGLNKVKRFNYHSSTFINSKCHFIFGSPRKVMTKEWFHLVFSLGAIKTISSENKPPQHFLFPISTPYLSQLFKTSLLNKLNRIGDKGQPWRTPRWIIKLVWEHIKKSCTSFRR